MEPYKTDETRWHASQPYGFDFWSANSELEDPATETFWLPISPQNINVTTHYATNIITTLYGIIEEHSEIRYYDITISGNTGIAPKFTKPFSRNKADSGTGVGLAAAAAAVRDEKPSLPGSPSIGRASYSPAKVSFGGFLPEVSNTIAAALNLGKSILGLDGVTGTGIRPEHSGYLAFHNFYKFLHKYKSDASGTSDTSKDSIGGSRANHPLQFVNYKDSLRYDVIPISFTLIRSADNPFLYNYSIKMRAFNLRSVDAMDDSNVSETLDDLGLGEPASLFARITSKTRNASTLISGIKGAF